MTSLSRWMTCSNSSYGYGGLRISFQQSVVGRELCIMDVQQLRAESKSQMSFNLFDWMKESDSPD